MLEVLNDFPANPNSADHAEGWRSADMLKHARMRSADCVGATEAEIVFTSGATEANNLALFGLSKRVEQACVLSIDHSSLRAPLVRLAEQGLETAEIPVHPSGLARLDALEQFISAAPTLVAIGLVNSEIGTIQPIEVISELCARHGALLHIDAAQVLGRLPVDVFDWGCTTASFSAHKAYGPKGVGALYISRSAQAQFSPLFLGGGQEFGIRPGTVPVFLASAFAETAQLAQNSCASDEADAARRRDALLTKLQSEHPAVSLNGVLGADRIGGNLNLAFPGKEAQRLLARLSAQLAVSTASACASGAIRDSHTLTALGLGLERIRSSLRLCFGRTNTDDDVARAADLILRALD